MGDPSQFRVGHTKTSPNPSLLTGRTCGKGRCREKKDSRFVIEEKKKNTSCDDKKMHEKWKDSVE